MLLVRSVTIRKIAQSLGVSAVARIRGAISQTTSERALRAGLNIEVQSWLQPRATLLLGLTLVSGAPSPALAQSDLRRPVRQVEMDDGVIEITNSHAADPGVAEEVTSVRALQARPARDQARDSSREEGAESLAAGEARGAVESESTSSAAHGSTGTTSWLLPLIVIIVAAGVSIWGLRRRKWRPFAPEYDAGSAAPGALEGEEVFDTDVLDEPAALDGGHLDGGQLDGQWALTVRDSVPPSSPPRSSRGANAPRQWVSQPLRVKSDES